ncbi:MAG: hypothetical protein ACTSWQ_09470, partial [Candidatus Thorarchaeota archaeon]
RVQWHTWLYVKITDSGLELGIEMDRQKFTSKLHGAELEKFVSLVGELSGFEVLIGSNKEPVNLAERFLDYTDREDQSDFFAGKLNLEKRFLFKNVQEELGLDTPMFPQHLLKEIQELKPIIMLLYKVLTGK